MSPQTAVIVVAFPACLALHASMAGQTVGAMNGAITGTVTDSTGAILSDVTIVISGAALMGTRVTVTSEEGLYSFWHWRLGSTHSYSRYGFKPVSREGIYVGLGFTATVDVELPTASLQEEAGASATSE